VINHKSGMAEEDDAVSAVDVDGMAERSHDCLKRSSLALSSRAVAQQTDISFRAKSCLEKSLGDHPLRSHRLEPWVVFNHRRLS
jgi:hypothetical protein